MQRISTLTKALNKFGIGKHGFQDGDMASNTSPTDFNAVWCDSVQEEICTLIEGAGLTLNPASFSQMYEAVQRLIDAQSGNYLLDTGAANAYVVAVNPAITAYTEGLTVRFRVVNGNTGASTLNAGAGAVPLVNDVAGALLSGDAPAGGIISATYDKTLNAFLIDSLVPSQAMSQVAADARYSRLNGNAAQVFAMAAPTLPEHGINLGQADARYGRFSTGNRIVCQMSTAPLGWVKDTTAALNDSALRIVTGNVGAGGLYNFSAGCTVVAPHTHAFSATSGTESADHSHSGTTGSQNANHLHGNGMYVSAGQVAGSVNGGGNTPYIAPSNTGLENAVHGHAFTTGGRSAAHNHAISGTTIDSNNSGTWIPKYVDVIVCTKQ